MAFIRPAHALIAILLDVNLFAYVTIALAVFINNTLHTRSRFPTV